MGLLADIKSISREIPLPTQLKGKIKLPRRRRRDADIEREELLVRIEELTAKNQALLKVAELDATDLEDTLSDQENSILQLLEYSNEASAREVAEALDFSLARAEYLLAHLKDKQYLVDSELLGRHSYLLDERGRASLKPGGVDD